jgi:hypothetical protein
VIPLRPIGLNEILDGSISAIRRYPKAMLGSAAIVMAVSTVISTAVTAAVFPDLRDISQSAAAGQPAGSQGTGALWLSILVSLLLTIASGVLLTGLLTAVMARAVLGQEVTVERAWRQARGRIGALSGLTVLILAIFLGMWGVLVVVAVLAPTLLGPGGLAITVIIAAAALPLTCYAAVRTSVAAPAVVLERVGPWQAIVRSWRLTTRSFWRVFGIWIILVLVTLVATLVLEVPFRVVSDIMTGTALPTGGSLAGWKLPAYLIISAIGSLAAATVTRPLLTGAAAVLYIDLRMRREGLDLTLQAAAGHDPGPDEAAATVWRPPASGPWPGGTGPGTSRW